MSSRKENEEQVVCEVMLRYTPFSSPTEISLTETVSIFFTQDNQVIKAAPQNNGVYIAVLMQEIGVLVSFKKINSFFYFFNINIFTSNY